MKINLDAFFLRKYFIVLILVTPFVSCVSSKWSFLAQECEGIKVRHLLESKLNFPPIARENRIEGLMTVALSYDTTFRVIPLKSNLKINKQMLGADQPGNMENILCQFLSNSLNKTFICHLRESKHEIVILYKLINSELDINKYKFDILIQTDTVEIIEINNH